MLPFLLKRFLAAIPVLFVLSVVTFAIIHARPGDYGDYVYSMLTSRGVSTTEAQRVADAARAQYGLNDSVPIQYARRIKGIVTEGNFGYSFYYNRPVRDVVAERLPATLALALTCHILATLFGISLG